MEMAQSVPCRSTGVYSPARYAFHLSSGVLRLSNCLAGSVVLVAQPSVWHRYRGRVSLRNLCLLPNALEERGNRKMEIWIAWHGETKSEESEPDNMIATLGPSVNFDKGDKLMNIIFDWLPQIKPSLRAEMK